MKKLYAYFAKLVNILGFPIKGLLIHNSRRVRIVMIAKQRILLTKSAIGSQKWSLPGGGVEKDEQSADACIRELREETGIALQEKLVALGTERLPADTKWPVASIEFFSTQLPNIIIPSIQRPLEILDVEWFPLSNLPPDLSRTVLIGLDLARKAERIS